MAKVITSEQATETEAVEQGQSPDELRRELAISRICRTAKLSDSATEGYITGGQSVDQVSRAVIQGLADRAPGFVGHPARVATSKDPVVELIERSLRGERGQDPLWLSLRQAGLGNGSNPVDVIRGALSTSDLPQLLTAAGDRVLLSRFTEAAGGILAAAAVRGLSDYRPASILDVGLVGPAKQILEGGEINFAAIAESSASYSPTRWGQGLSLSPESIANDDLAGLAAALEELAASCLDAEKTALVDLLEGAATGRPAADTLALFHTDHKNTVTAGPLAIGKLGEAVALLRGQKTIGGRYVDLAPASIICAPATELLVRQLLSDQLAATEPNNVNPWLTLAIEVEPRLSGTYAYLLAGGPRKPLELGRLSAAPSLLNEIQFSTGFYRAKAEHSFGCAVSEFRSIVRIKVGA